MMRCKRITGLVVFAIFLSVLVVGMGKTEVGLWEGVFQTVSVFSVLPFLIIAGFFLFIAVFFFGSLFVEGILSMIALIGMIILWPTLGRQRALGWNDWVMQPVEKFAVKINSEETPAKSEPPQPGHIR